MNERDSKWRSPEQPADELFQSLYDELHRMAAAVMSRERRNHTLQPTALLNEVWLKLVRCGQQPSAAFNSHEHFLSVAAVAMRRILVNHAKAKRAEKRDGARTQVPLNDLLIEFEDRAIDLLALDEAMERLTELDATQAKIVELRFFAGLTAEQCAELLSLSLRTIHYEWAHARAWLRRELEPESGDS